MVGVLPHPTRKKENREQQRISTWKISYSAHVADFLIASSCIFHTFRTKLSPYAGQ